MMDGSASSTTTACTYARNEQQQRNQTRAAAEAAATNNNNSNDVGDRQTAETDSPPAPLNALHQRPRELPDCGRRRERRVGVPQPVRTRARGGNRTFVGKTPHAGLCLGGLGYYVVVVAAKL